MAFLQAVLQVVDAEKPGALFRRVAAYKGMDRADDKPLSRNTRAVGPRSGEGREGPLAPLRQEQAPAIDRLPHLAGVAEQYLPRKVVRPVSLKELLRPYDRGPREGPYDDGEAGTE